jgi:hemolysin activation/secretion protein
LGNDEKEFAGKRFNAKPNYAYLKADLKHTQKLPNDWSLQARLSGQLANEPLISAEQFTIGGVDSVRGYLESSALGDNGVSGTLELRTPPLIKYIKTDFFKEFYAYSFIDAGYVSIYDALPNQDKNSDLLSAGLGVKLKATNGFYSNIDYAHALRDSGDVKSGDDRLHFKVGFEW